MQDIAGCRIIAADISEQNQIIETLKKDFPNAVIKDRRREPSHGYRAVHVIAKVEGKAIEIQIRSFLQHLWAELSERASDAIDPEIKYGDGNEDYQQRLRILSKQIDQYENEELSFADARRSNPLSGPIMRAMVDEHLKNLTRQHDTIVGELLIFAALCNDWKKGKK